MWTSQCLEGHTAIAMLVEQPLALLPRLTGGGHKGKGTEAGHHIWQQALCFRRWYTLTGVKAAGLKAKKGLDGTSSACRANEQWVSSDGFGWGGRGGGDNSWLVSV